MATDARATSRNLQLTEAILKHLNEYLSIRFDHAIRINPALRTIKEDLLYHEVENVRTCLMGEKIYGVNRMVVAKVLMGDDEKKRRGLMSPTDQNSIQVELVSHVRETVAQATRGQIKIHDLKSFYSAINPMLNEMMDLIETWIWWDVFDSSEIARFEQKLGLLQLMRQGRMPPEMRRLYGTLIRTPAEGASEATAETDQAVTDDEILQYEGEKLVHIRDQWKMRRQYDHGYMFVLQRDELPAVNQGALIHQIADRVREYDRIDQSTDIDEDMRHAYAPTLKVAPAKVTREILLEHLQAKLVEAEREMLLHTDAERHLGPPYRFKVRQLEIIDKWIRELGIKSEQTGPAQAEEQPAPAKA
jgi:hypothetical protein